MCVSLTGLALSITASAERLGCAPYGRHTLIRCAHPSGQPAAVTALRYVSLLAQERCAKEGHPASGFRCAKLDSLRSPCGPAYGCYSASLRFLAPVPLRGPAYKGRPWPFKRGRHRYLAASLRLVPLRDTSTRPPDGTGSRACEIFERSNSAVSGVGFCSSTAMAQTTPKSPSGGRVESPWKGLSDMDVARATMGQGWPFVACPRSGDGAREPRRSRGRMNGVPFSLVTFSWASKRK